MTLRKFRVDILRTEKYELDVIAENVAHAEDITNALFGNRDELASGLFSERDLRQFDFPPGRDPFDLLYQHGEEIEVDWVHDAE